MYAFDSTTIDLCLNVFWWAKFRKRKGGIKLNTLFDVTTQIPAFVHVSVARAHVVNAMDMLVYEPEAYYILDRDYVDFERLYRITWHFAYFVVRAKMNLCFKRLYSLKSNKETGVKSNQIGKITGFYVSKDYPEKLRRVKFYDKESDRTFVFLSNNFELSAQEIAFLYKTDGRLSYSSSGSNNIRRSRHSGVQQKTLCVIKYIRPSFHIVWSPLLVPA